MTKLTTSIIIFLVAAGAVAYYYYFHVRALTEPVPPPLPAVVEEMPAPITRPVAEPAVSEVVTNEPEPEPEPLPALGNSDPVVAATLAGLVGTSAFDQLFNVQQIVQHIVATVDNLPRRKLSQKVIPVKSVTGDFTVEGEQASLKVSAGNYARYDPYVALITATDTTELVDSYHRFYPLFQEAYTELGYPEGDFNWRLIAVVDHLLETPDVGDPVYLIKPEAFYIFEDPDLEALSAGQKALIRMGRNNASAVKSKLEEFRLAISD